MEEKLSPKFISTEVRIDYKNAKTIYKYSGLVYIICAAHRLSLLVPCRLYCMCHALEVLLDAGRSGDVRVVAGGPHGCQWVSLVKETECAAWRAVAMVVTGQHNTVLLDT